MPVKKFLENYALYRKFDFPIKKHKHGRFGSSGTKLRSIPKPAINMYCSTCRSRQTFNMINEYYGITNGNKKVDSSPVANQSFKLDYVCSACRQRHFLFFVDFGVTQKEDKNGNVKWDDGWVRKIGQKPAWSITLNKKIARFLSEKEESLFKKGLICESQSYGIGAYSYYRRVVESIITDLLDRIESLIPEGSERDKYADALKETKQEHIASNKIRLVKDLLPGELKTYGYNPLEVIYSSISDGLHNWTDEECLEISEAIRRSTEFLVTKVYANKEANKKFSEGMKKLLQNKF